MVKSVANKLLAVVMIILVLIATVTLSIYISQRVKENKMVVVPKKQCIESYIVEDGVTLEKNLEESLGKNFFSELHEIPNATYLQNEEYVATIARPTSEFSPRAVARALIQNEVIMTYQHLQADVCLTSDGDTEDEYISSFTIVHSYCTNDCYDEEYELQIRIEKETGKIFVSQL